MIGFIVGMRSEARWLRPLRGRVVVAFSGATRQGAEAATARLIGAGATHLVSLGLAAGLDPALRPGDLLVPSRVVVQGKAIAADAELCDRLGGTTPGGLLHSDRVVAASAEKRALHAASRCVALDMESGVLALAARASGLPFAALRAICDPVERELPEAARIALDPDGGLAWVLLLRAVLRKPYQIPALVALAGDAARARRALTGRIAQVRP